MTLSREIIKQNMQILKHYVCAVCWGNLMINQKGVPVCVKYGEEHQGFVTKYYAEKRRAESYADRANAAWNLGEFISEPKTEEEISKILEILGF